MERESLVDRVDRELRERGYLPFPCQPLDWIPHEIELKDGISSPGMHVSAADGADKTLPAATEAMSDAETRVLARLPGHPALLLKQPDPSCEVWGLRTDSKLLDGATIKIVSELLRLASPRLPYVTAQLHDVYVQSLLIAGPEPQPQSQSDAKERAKPTSMRASRGEEAQGKSPANSMAEDSADHKAAGEVRTCSQAPADERWKVRAVEAWRKIFPPAGRPVPASLEQKRSGNKPSRTNTDQKPSKRGAKQRLSGNVDSISDEKSGSLMGALARDELAGLVGDAKSGEAKSGGSGVFVFVEMAARELNWKWHKYGVWLPTTTPTYEFLSAELARRLHLDNPCEPNCCAPSVAPLVDLSMSLRPPEPDRPGVETYLCVEFSKPGHIVDISPSKTRGLVVFYQPRVPCRLSKPTNFKSDSQSQPAASSSR